MTPRIIALHGPQGSGKDTLTASWMANHPDYLHMKFADLMYAMAQQLDPAFDPNMPHAEKDSPLWGLEGMPTRRRILQTLGTEWARGLDPDFWVKVMGGRLQLTDYPVIISDLRFENEATYLRTLGATIVHLYPNWPCATSSHQSDVRLKVGPGDLRLALSFGQVAQASKDFAALVGDS